MVNVLCSRWSSHAQTSHHTGEYVTIDVVVCSVGRVCVLCSVGRVCMSVCIVAIYV